MNQLTLAAIAAAVLVAGSFTAGWRMNGWRRDSAQLTAERAAAAATQAATDAAVKAIQSIDIKRVTIRQELEREIHYAPAGAECDLPAGVFDALNKSLAPPGSDSAVVP